jgi:cytochrome c oxidase cbb3-type subunit III
MAMSTRKVRWLCWAACLATTGLSAQNSEKPPDKKVANPFGKDKAAIEAGRIQFNSGCAACHGPTGQGGRGSRLADVDRVRQMRDGKIFEVIKEGVSGTQMPPSSLGDEQIWQLVSFIRSLNAGAIDQDVPGDVSIGESLFFGAARCAQCHMIRGQGGLLGPDLSNIGANRPLEKLRRSLEEPDAAIEPGFQRVSAVTLDGRRISGIAKNNSNYSIQIQDPQGRFHLLLKRDLKELVHHKNSVMPKPSLSEKDMQNLLAFVSRQSLESPEERARRLEQGREVEP